MDAAIQNDEETLPNTSSQSHPLLAIRSGVVSTPTMKVRLVRSHVVVLAFTASLCYYTVQFFFSNYMNLKSLTKMHLFLTTKTTFPVFLHLSLKILHPLSLPAFVRPRPSFVHLCLGLFVFPFLESLRCIWLVCCKHLAVRASLYPNCCLSAHL